MIDLIATLSFDAALRLLVLLPSGYVMMSCVVRTRFGMGTQISWRWCALYFAVALCAAGLMATALYGHHRVIDAVIALTIAAYIRATADAWAENVPKSAQPQT